MLICETGKDFNHTLAKDHSQKETTNMRYVLPVLLLAACATPDITPDATSLPDTCGASEYAYLIGQPATALERVLIMDKVRIIRPDTMVTMDYREDRINFMVSDQSIISDVTCG